MKLTLEKIRRLIREELEVHLAPDDLECMGPEEAYGVGYYAGKDYEDDSPDLSTEPPTVEDAWYPSDVVPREDAWAGGDNIDDPLDHARFETGESNAGPHVVIREGDLVQLSDYMPLSSPPPGMRAVVDDPVYFKEYGERAKDIVGDTILNPNRHIPRWDSKENPMNLSDPKEALINAANALSNLGVPPGTYLGIIEDGGGFYQPAIIGKLSDALQGRFDYVPGRWYDINHEHDYEIMYIDESAAGIEDIGEETPFISLGRVMV